MTIIIATITTIIGFCVGCFVGFRIALWRLEEVLRERDRERISFYASLAKAGKMEPEDILRRERQHS